MSLLKRDILKILGFLLICGALRALNGVSDGFRMVCLVCFTALVGLLPYMAARAKWKENKQPFFVFLVLEVVLTNLLPFLTRAWLLHLVAIVDGTIFFLLVMAVFGKHKYSFKPVVRAWGKWLAAVGFFYILEMFVYAFIFSLVRETIFASFTFIIIPLVYLAVTYGLAAWTLRKAK